MLNQRLWAQIQDVGVVVMIALALGLSAAMPAGAQQNITVTELSPPPTEWKKMLPSSFKATPKSAYDQCMRTSTIKPDDELTPEKCQILFRKLASPGQFTASEQCKRVMVPDGTVYNYLNGRSGGVSQTLPNRIKMLGRDDRAVACDLGDGVVAHFFKDDPGKSCNNVAFVFPKPTPTATSEKIWVCHMVSSDDPVQTSSPLYIPGFSYAGCGCCGSTFVPGVVIPGSSGPNETSFRQICHWHTP